MKRLLLSVVTGAVLVAGCQKGTGQEPSSNAVRPYGGTTSSPNVNRDFSHSESNIEPGAAVGGSGGAAALDAELGTSMAQTYKGKGSRDAGTSTPDAGTADAGTPDAGMMQPDAGTMRPDAGTMRRDAGR